MIQILQLFVRLCLFQGQAHDVPRSEVLLFIAGLAAIISNSVNAIPNMGVFSGILLSIGQVLLFAVLISLILKVRGMGELLRCHQPKQKELLMEGYIDNQLSIYYLN